METTRSVCIIGAGITGLTAAYRLSCLGYKVTVIECTMNSGGMVSTFSMGWEKIEHIYHHIFTSDKYVIDLAEELSVDDQMQWLEPKDALFINKHLYPFTSPADLLRFKPIPFIDRIRTGLMVLKAKKIDDLSVLESMTAKKWLLQGSGQRSYDTLWKPLLRSKFDDDSDTVSAVWIWNKFKLRGSSRSKSIHKESLGYMNGGFGTLVNALVKGIESNGGSILYGYTALDISKEVNKSTSGKTFRISCVLSDCSSVVLKSDSVIATLSGVRFANMTRDLSLPALYIKKAMNVKYKGNLCLVLRLKKSLSPYYWTTVCDPLPFVVVIEHTNLTSLRKYGGHVVYLSRYLDISDPLWTQSDSDIYKLFCKGLAEIYPDFTPADVKDWRLTRTRYAQPVINQAYPVHMPEMKTPEDGLVLAGMAQIYPEDRGMNYAIRLGNDAAGVVSEYFSKNGA
ncbi:MAG: NAD(P)/FAD-dependent oxidoreductase [Saccharofermentanales bacterium]